MDEAPVRSLEIEQKFDVEAVTPLPDLGALPGVETVAGPDARALDAVYLDTDDLVLARAAVALRRRTGGPDEGWHVKTTAPEGRHEHGWPLDDGSGEPDAIVVPSAVIAAVETWVRNAVVRPIARLRNARDAYALRDAEGALVAEFTDDRVIAEDLRRGVETVWREWEIELGPAAPLDDAGRGAFFAAAASAVAAAGGRPAASDSKLQRALGR